jgi:hypothetical protein
MIFHTLVEGAQEITEISLNPFTVGLAQLGSCKRTQHGEPDVIEISTHNGPRQRP